MLSTPEQADAARRVAEMLGPRSAGIFPRAVMHVPIETAREARDEARRLGADCAVAIGGGSTTGLGKAIALDSGLPIIAIPTTYAGSEMTPIYGLTEGGVKKTGRDPRVLPKTVIYDPELTLTLPVGLSVTSGLNAIAHAAEGLYAHDGNPIVALMAEEGIRALAPRCRDCMPTQPTRAARSDALLRRLAVRRRARPRVDGAAPQAVPHARRQLRPAACRDARRGAAARAGLQRRARARSDASHRPSARRERIRTERRRCTDRHPRAGRRLGAPTSLRQIGMPEDGLDRVADLAVTTPYPNPRPLERAALRALLQRAFEGARAATDPDTTTRRHTHEPEPPSIDPGRGRDREHRRDAAACGPPTPSRSATSRRRPGRWRRSARPTSG